MNCIKPTLCLLCAILVVPYFYGLVVVVSGLYKDREGGAELGQEGPIRTKRPLKTTGEPS